MTSLKIRRTRFGFALLAVGTMLGTAGPALAQSSQFVGGTTQFREDPAAALTRHLRALSDNPRSVGALTGAGKAALELGDAQAALTFFARAEEVAPRDGRVKAGMGSSLLMMMQVQSAQRFFTEAATMGMPEAELARDRGLAYDLLGDPKRAQKDYALALSRTADPEVQRRMALSLAISGDKEGALKMIDDQVRRQDPAGWRTRAFVLALTGDSEGATGVVQRAMPLQAAQMRPFLAKLPSLNPAERAMAVHFGHFPGDGKPVQMAEANVGSYPAPPSVTSAGRPDTSQPALGRRNPAPAPVSNAPRRRPGALELAGRAPTSASKQFMPPKAKDAAPTSVVTAKAEPARPSVATAKSEPVRQPASIAAVEPQPKPAPAQGLPPAPVPIVNSSVAREPEKAVPAPTVLASNIAASPATPTLGRTPSIASLELPASTALASPLVPQVVEGASVSSTTSAPATTAAAEPAATAPAAKSSFEELAASIAALADAPAPADTKAQEPVQLAKAEVKAEVKTAAKAGAAPKKDTAPSAAAKGSTRHWVQIASAADTLAASEFKRLKAKAPKLLGDKSGWTSSWKSTNRLLVGPFDNEKEAQSFVNELAKADLAAFSWTSPEGQEIEKLPGK